MKTPQDPRFLIYRTADEAVTVEATIQDDSIWLTQKAMAALFGCSTDNISQHLKNIFNDGELRKEAVTEKISATAADGKRYATQFYNLDAIISVGYRVNSKRATQFRIWATSILREYMTKGFALDDARLKQGERLFGQDYFRELDLILSAYRYDIISFNNGLHSLTTSREEWKNAYRAAVDFIRKKCPDAKLFLTNNTPLKDPKKTAQAKELNSIIAETAKLKNLPVIDLFSLMDPLDRNKFWSDTYHFRKPAVELQAERIAQTVRSVPNALNPKANIIQRGTETGPSGALK